MKNNKDKNNNNDNDNIKNKKIIINRKMIKKITIIMI